MQAIITVGLGFGDEGKGSAVDYLVRKHKSKLVVRYSGGHQCAHNVVLPDGTHHTFAQFGSGTFAGADTYLSQHVIIEPMALIAEAKVLAPKLQTGLQNTLSRLSIANSCLVTTPYHKFLNQIKETYRTNKHGSCGVGIGETRKYWLDHGKESILAKNLRSEYPPYITKVREKLELCRQRLLIEAQEYDSIATSKLIKQMYKFNGHAWLDEVLEISTKLNYIEDFIPYNNDPCVVFEGAQGVLLDEYCGFHPHTTWSTTTARNALELLKDTNDTKTNRTIIGVTRAYHTRHGAGPFPTEVFKGKFRDTVLQDDHNELGKYQGNFRVGYFDLTSHDYALACQPIDEIFVSCVDHVDEDNIVCQGYAGMFPSYSLNVQQEIGTYLSNIEDFPEKDTMNIKDMINHITGNLPNPNTGYISRGKTYKDKERI